VSPYILPHLAARPLTMIRMPDGIKKERFLQKHWQQNLGQAQGSMRAVARRSASPTHGRYGLAQIA